MLLFEAKSEIDKRLSENLKSDFGKHIPEYFEALELASKCIDAQQRLAHLLNEFWDGLTEADSFSAQLTYDMLRSCSIEAKFDEDGMYLTEEEEADE